MYDTRDLVKRSEKCLTCHLGTPEKSVDHELIAAGHPDLYFELDSFMSVMPPHWKEVDTDPWFAVRAMAVGQAVQMREQLKRGRANRKAASGPNTASWTVLPAITTWWRPRTAGGRSAGIRAAVPAMRLSIFRASWC